jgi:hypothetical protein
MAAFPIKKELPSVLTHHFYLNPDIHTLGKHIAYIESNPDLTFHHDDEYESITKPLMNIIKQPGSKWCDGVEEEYVEYIFNNCNGIIVLKHAEELLGFCSIIFKKSHIHIDIICTNNEYKGVGTVMINAINDIGYDLDMDKVTLESITTAVGFYLKMGYKCVDDVCPMDKDIETRSQPRKTMKRKYNSQSNVSRKSSKTSTKRATKAKSPAVKTRTNKMTKAKAKASAARITKAPRRRALNL